MPGTVVRNIKIDNSWYNGLPDNADGNKRYYSGLPYLCGICVAGGATIDQVVFDWLWQSVFWNAAYADCKAITRCVISGHAGNSHILNNAGVPMYGTDDNDSTYAIYTGYLGDSLIVQGNAIHNPQNTKGVYINHPYGATVDSNIFNCNVVLENCIATTFSNNHLENVDVQLQIKCSNVTVQGNYFQKGAKPAIKVIPDEHALSMVSLIDNVFQWMGKLTKLEVAEEFVNEMSSICKYDISFISRNSFNMPNERIKATLSITNCYRLYRYNESVQYPLPFGVKMCRQNVSLSGAQLPLDSINDLSPLLSVSGVILPGERISMPVIVCNDLHRIRLHSNNVPIIKSPEKYDPEKDGVLWLGATARISYFYRLAWNQKRCIYMYDENKCTLMALRENVYVTGFSETNRSYGEFMFSLSSKDGDPEESGLLFYIILYRKSVSPLGSVKWEMVEVPMCGGTLLYDNGICVCDFNWEPCTEPSEEVFNDGIIGIEYHGQNVVVYSEKPVDFTIGEWNVGDRVYNVGSDDSWTMQIKK